MMTVSLNPQVVPHTPVAALAEGPVWLPEERQLYWLDIEGCRLFRLNFPVAASPFCETFVLPNKVGCLAPTMLTGHLLLATQEGVWEIGLPPPDPAAGPRTLFQSPATNQGTGPRFLADPEAGRPENRYNDGKCSPEGRFWFGSLNMVRQQGQAALYMLEEQENGNAPSVVRCVLAGATNSNGLGWSPDGGTFYWIDTPTRRVAAFDYEAAAGTLANQRVAVQFPEDASFGRPDGMTVDAEGMLWVAHWLGGRVTRWNPADGELLTTIKLPVARVTSLTFGGPNLDRLYITTARQGMREEEIDTEDGLCGCLFEVVPGVRGLPVHRFRAIDPGKGQDIQSIR